MEIIGWAVLSESYIWDEDLILDSENIMASIIAKFGEPYANEIIELYRINGSAIVSLVMGHNHYTSRTDDFIKMFDLISEVAPGSYGKMYIYDNEGKFAPYNVVTELVLARGEVKRYQDAYFTPYVPKIEGPDPDDDSPPPVSERIEKFLPIGTIVTLNGGDKKLMIFGRLQKDTANDKVFDYVGCPYPEGNVSPKATFLFNHADIAWVHYLGYADEDETVWNEKLRTLPTVGR
jgi:hypothetical protein